MQSLASRAVSITYLFLARLTIERFKSCDLNRRIKHASQQIVLCGFKGPASVVHNSGAGLTSSSGASSSLPAGGGLPRTR